jgi:hypothetical protein
LALLLFFAPLVGLADEPQPKTAAATPVAKAAGESFRVPYQLTDTKHILVRARINGKGPFHLIMDTGAPALFVSTESAKKHGLPAAGKDGWGEFDKFEIEGGPVLEKVKARVETPFQVSGMNAMGLPGIRLDGMLGYTILAQYRIELDLTKQHMVWTKLNWKPPTPQGISENGQPAPEISAMSNMAQLVQMFMKKKPEPVFVQRGLLGIELEDGKEAVVIGKVLPESPAAKAGLKPGDRIVQFQDKPVKNVAELHALAAEHAAKDQLSVEVERAGQKQTLNVATGRGL